MKRRTENHQSQNVNGIGIGIGNGGGVTQSTPIGMDFDIDDDEGWSFQRIGCGGCVDGNGSGSGSGSDNGGTGSISYNNIRTDMVFSSSSVGLGGGGGGGGPEINNSADFFLNQTSYVNNGRQRLRRRNNNNSNNKPKRPPKNNNKSSKKNKNDNDDDLSSLIASELTKMSLEDREKVLEEVHGVVSDEDEDPEEISKLLVQVKDELKRIRYKQAYEKAAFNSNSYVTDPEFVLMFLRADNYQPRPAAMRLVEHFKYKLELFGEDTLVRDIMYSDLTDGDKSVLHSSFVQMSQLTDQAGRPIVICNMSEFLNTNLNNMNRAMWYLSYRHVQINASAGKNGVVGVFITHGMGNIFEKFSRESLTGTGFLGIALPGKYASVHFCSENNAFAMAVQTTLMLSLGKYARVRLRSHCGSRLECAYALKGFGIDIDNFGLANSLTLSKSHQVMIQRCQLMDQVLKTKQDARLLPHPNDVLLGRGRPFQLFPGNLALTDTINIYRTRYVASKKMDKKIITSEIVGNIRNSGGRFLKRANDDNHSDVDWVEVDFETARLKVSHSFRTMTKWHADRGHECDNGSQSGVSGELIAMSDESIQSIAADEIMALGIVAESTPSSSDAQANGMYYEMYAQASFMNSETSNKRRRG